MLTWRYFSSMPEGLLIDRTNSYLSCNISSCTRHYCNCDILHIIKVFPKWVNHDPFFTSVNCARMLFCFSTNNVTIW